MAENFWWDINKSLSYDKLFNFIVGTRGGGKSYGAKRHVVNRWLKHRERFVYVRRYENELAGMNNWFVQIAQEFPDREFEYKDRELILDAEVMGWCIPLSLAYKQKSSTFDNVKWIIFDEFIAEEGSSGYLKNEVRKFFDLCETVCRMGDFKAFFLANAVSFFNPYFNYFSIQLPYGSKFKAYDDILIEIVENAGYLAAKEQTRFGRFLVGSEYANYAYQNTFADMHGNFIAKKSGNLTYCFTLVFDAVSYGVWMSQDNLVWVSTDIQQNHPIVFSLDTKSHDIGLYLQESFKANPMLKQVLEYYKRGMMRFDDKKSNNFWQQIIKYM